MSVDISKLDFKLRDELNGYLEELVREGVSVVIKTSFYGCFPESPGGWLELKQA